MLCFNWLNEIVLLYFLTFYKLSLATIYAHPFCTHLFQAILMKDERMPRMRVFDPACFQKKNKLRNPWTKFFFV